MLVMAAKESVRSTAQPSLSMSLLVFIPLFVTNELNSRIQGMSAGSLNTIVSVMQSYGTGWLRSGNNRSLAANSNKLLIQKPAPLLSRIFGYRNIPGIGMGTTSFLAICNESIAHHSSSLLPEMYGPDFNLHEYLPTTSVFEAVFTHFLTRFGILLICFPPVLWLAKYLIPESGTGPALATAGTERQEFRAIGSPSDTKGESVSARYIYEGSLYYCSAFMGVEAALTVLGEEKTYAHELGGGVLTAAMLGMPFIERIRDAGVQIEVDV